MKIIKTWNNLKWNLLTDDRIDVQEDDTDRLRTKRSNVSSEWGVWANKKGGQWSKELINALDNTAPDIEHTKLNEEQIEGINSLKKWMRE